MAFKIAGSMAFKEAARRAKPVLLEPVMAVEVTVPEEFMGTIIGDLELPPRPYRRHGDAWAAYRLWKATVPLSTMFGYATAMRGSTQGRANFSMEFKQYEEAPRSVSEEIIAKVQGKDDSKRVFDKRRAACWQPVKTIQRRTGRTNFAVQTESTHGRDPNNGEGKV